MIFTKHKEGVSANRPTKYEIYVAGKCTRAGTSLARSTQIEYYSHKMAHQSIKY